MRCPFFVWSSAYGRSGYYVQKDPKQPPVWMVSLYRGPAKFILWGEQKAQRLHLLQGNLIVDCRFRRAR